MRRIRFSSHATASKTSIWQKIGQQLRRLNYAQIAMVFGLAAVVLLVFKSVQFVWLLGLFWMVFHRLNKVHKEGNNFLKDLKMAFSGFWLPVFVLTAGLWIIIYLM